MGGVRSSRMRFCRLRSPPQMENLADEIFLFYINHFFVKSISVFAGRYAF